MIYECRCDERLKAFEGPPGEVVRGGALGREDVRGKEGLKRPVDGTRKRRGAGVAEHRATNCVKCLRRNFDVKG
jgi:hypothetical protein